LLPPRIVWKTIYRKPPDSVFMAQYDVVIIGGGHNGLASACIMARNGLKVLVLERREIVGGMCATEEIFSGFSYDTGCFYPYWLRQDTVDELRLSKHGLEFIDSGGIAYSALFPDGRYLTVYEDAKKTGQEIEKFSRKDAQSYLEFVTFWKRFRPVVDAFLLSPPPPLDLLTDIAKPLPVKVALLKLLGRLPPSVNKALDFLKEPENIEALAEFFFKPMGAKLDELFESDYVKIALASESLVVSQSGPSSAPLSALVWRVIMKERTGRVRGGMGNFPLALKKAAEDAGARILVNAEVERVIVKDRVARGVKLKNGEEIESRIVASNADPHRTFLGLVGQEHFDDRTLKRIMKYRLVSTGLRLNYALSRKPSFAIPDEKLVGALTYCPSLDYAEKAFAEAAMGDPPGKPLLLLDVPTAADSTLAPSGAHILQSWVNPTVYEARRGSWDTIKESYADNLTHLIAESASNFENSILHRFLQTPLDYERRFYATGGDVEHGDLSYYQLLWFRPILGYYDGRTPIRNLYLVGSGIHPGGGVRALAGMIAARTILSDIESGRIA